MEQAKIDRINELAALSKQRELSEQEKSEREILRKEYIADWRRGAEQTLSRVVLVEADGKKTPLRKKGEGEK